MELKPKSLGIDIRQEFEKFIDEHGFYMIFARALKPLHCHCWNSLTREANPTCNACLGTGYKLEYERHKVREVDIAADTLAGAIAMLATGPQVATTRFFFAKLVSQPYEGMLMIHTQWVNNAPIRAGLTVYEVNDASVLYGKHGAPSFFKIAATSKSDIASRFDDIQISSIRVVD